MKRSVSDDDLRDEDDRGKRHRSGGGGGGSRTEIRMLVPSRVRPCIFMFCVCVCVCNCASRQLMVVTHSQETCTRNF